MRVLSFGIMVGCGFEPAAGRLDLESGVRSDDRPGDPFDGDDPWANEDGASTEADVDTDSSADELDDTEEPESMIAGGCVLESSTPNGMGQLHSVLSNPGDLPVSCATRGSLDVPGGPVILEWTVSLAARGVHWLDHDWSTHALALEAPAGPTPAQACAAVENGPTPSFGPGDCLDSLVELPEPPPVLVSQEIGGETGAGSWQSESGFLGNTFLADVDTVLERFSQHVGATAGCQIDQAVYEGTDHAYGYYHGWTSSAWTLVATTSHFPASTGDVWLSLDAGVPVVAGRYYVLAMASVCETTWHRSYHFPTRWTGPTLLGSLNSSPKSAGYAGPGMDPPPSDIGYYWYYVAHQILTVRE